MEGFNSFDDNVDFNSFINYPEETVESNPSIDFQFPSMDDFSTEALSFSDMQLSPDLDFFQGDFSSMDSDAIGYSNSGSANESSFRADTDAFQPQAEDFRYVVDSWASTDSSARSMKQKRRDAAIDLHLHRFMNAHCDSQLYPADLGLSQSNTPSLTSSHESSRQSPVAGTPASPNANREPATRPETGGRELVFDINLNTATQLPKKQKKRTQAQLEDYVNARRNGACVKHKKQHKKCNCHEKRAAKKATDLKVKKRMLSSSKVLVPVQEFVVSGFSESPSSVSKSSFSTSVMSSPDNVSFNEEIESALASLEDLQDLQDPERWRDSVPQFGMTNMPYGQHTQSVSTGFVSSVHHRPDNPTESSLGLRANVQHSTELTGSGATFDHLLGLRDDMSDRRSRDSTRIVTPAEVSQTSSQLQEGVPTAVPPVSSAPTVPAPSRLLVGPSGAVSSGLPAPTVVVSSSHLPVEPSVGVPLGLPSPTVLVSSRLPVETSAAVPSVSLGRQTVSTLGVPPLSSIPVLQVSSGFSSRTSEGSSMPVSLLQSAGQLVLTETILKQLTTILTPQVWHAAWNAIQPPKAAILSLESISQTDLFALHQCHNILTAALYAIDCITRLCGMFMQTMEQVALMLRSGWYQLAAEAEPLRLHNLENVLLSRTLVQPI